MSKRAKFITKDRIDTVCFEKCEKSPKGRKVFIGKVESSKKVGSTIYGTRG